jgi:hypothetical protein
MERLKEKLDTAKRGGSIKKYQNGGMTGAAMKAKGTAMKAKGTAMKVAGSAQKAKGAAMKANALGKKVALRTTYTPGVRVGSQSVNSDGSISQSMKTGGMVNANASIKKQTVPGSKGVKSGVNPRATASKVARGRVGGISTAPKTASPKMKMGGAKKKR